MEALADPRARDLQGHWRGDGRAARLGEGRAHPQASVCV